MIPLHVDVPMWRLPWVNGVLILAVTGISIAGFADEGVVAHLGGVEHEIRLDQVPQNQEDLRRALEDAAEWKPSLPRPVLAVTSTFVHGGFFHLLGNMLFLWVFGNAVNYKLGHVLFPTLYFLAGFCGSMAHYLAEGQPVIGASGAIYGVVGAFVVFFPRNDITVLWIIYVRPFLLTMSSFWVVLYWVGWDLLYLALGSRTGVALVAHLVGFLVGFVIALFLAGSGRIESERYEQSLIDLLRRPD